MKRSFLLLFLITLVGLIYIGRLFQLQIIRGANPNPIQSSAIKIEYDYPERGYVYDRNNKLLVANQLSYDVMIIPKNVTSLDTLEFSKLLKIDKKSFKKRYKKAENFARWLPSVFLKQLAKEDFAYLQEKLPKYKGFYIQKRIIREYPIKIGANILGFIAEVNEQKAKTNNYYEQGELIGKLGVEKQYETVLRGVKGRKFFKRNNLNKITGSYKDGKYDTLAVTGKDLTLTIDSELQAYGELLMTGKRGGIVAIEPKTGEILALVTAPSYDPNLLVGRKRSPNSVKLFNDTVNMPTFDRGLQAMYPPGSPFKILNGLIGLQEEVIDENFGVYCHHGYRYGSGKSQFMGCHCGITGRPIHLKTAIAKSCNSYFATIYKKIIDKSGDPKEGMDTWNKHVESFGLGNFLGYDLPVGRKGMVPNTEFYNKWYKNRWRSTYTISNAIGQGEILTTPMQLANMTAAIANKGYFHIPHIVKKINNKAIIDTTYTIKRNTTIDPKHFPIAIEAMHEVFTKGTARRYQVKDIEICGKTGTSENKTKMVDGKKVQAKDHSIFIAFAPKDDPKIAIAIFVENGGYGSTIAGPVTSLLIEKYLRGSITNKHLEQRMINMSLQKEYDKLIKKNDTLATGTK
ncbi:penicillin-binding protein 2 [Tenacibaculum piscium]|uniref:Penicillin-binding protein n=2 Tax=Tenacibaculum piscium TaxID=1458515 RepID=A0A2H1YHR7_9FLAO|nr:penicillin-binding protein 2 [Tenacibaculum piscium]MBE7629934.1 penicillin-binding protein 2 [Tenacibaculum piscium]MBE7670346.1 penicillin-binding protein 2 [Tenacibaculum piscium]MBE7685891.1 penicillin-binding protein 2 [Tenacibaculum piscium]MBE7690498.1 penicillin-binding protein 2 [Tenacibaculum piscium]SOS75056.1 Penicillin-binding protein [Tenacibaculum piscium]